MLTIPWRAASDELVATTIVQVSRLELEHGRDVPGFLLAALRLRREALATPGAVGISLRAAPSHKTFWTLSAWHSQASLTAFVRSDAHRAVMAQYQDRMAGSHFHTWTRLESETRPAWDDAWLRFDASTAAL